MNYSLELELAIHKTDSNKLLGRHWRSKHEVFERVKREIFHATRKNKPPLPLKKFKLTFHRYSAKTLDFDNYISSLKSYIDGIKQAGIIEDDSWDFIRGIEVDQFISKERKIVIHVKEVTQ